MPPLNNHVRRKGSFAPLSAHYYLDDALAQAGEAAELLYVRGLAFCAATLSDGFISDAQLPRGPGVGMRDTEKRAKKLVEVNLWLREERGYRVRSWLKWNLSAAEITEAMAEEAARKIPLLLRRQILDRDGRRCRKCGATADLHIDHIFPWSKGGRHDPSNLQVLCRSCNLRKGAKV